MDIMQWMFEPRSLEHLASELSREEGFAECKQKILAALDEIFLKEFTGVPPSEKFREEQLFFRICKAVSAVQFEQRWQDRMR